MNIADVVSGRAKWRGIQWVLFSATACKVLADQLRALLPARALPGPLHPREVRFKPGRELTAYYDARIYREGRETKVTCVRPIAVSWGPDTGANWKADIIKAVAEAERHSVAAPFLQLMADFPAWSMRIQVSPLDARFTQLARLSDPRHVRAMLADTYESGDRKSTRLNSSHLGISYAVFCLKKKKNISTNDNSASRSQSLEICNTSNCPRHSHERHHGRPSRHTLKQTVENVACDRTARAQCH